MAYAPRSPVGITAEVSRTDLSDYGQVLDAIEALGVDSIELPIGDMDIILGGHIRAPHLSALQRATAGRKVAYSVHGPLAINFFHPPFRLARHLDVLEASLDITAAVGATTYVLHTGLIDTLQQDGIEAAYAQQREMLTRAGDLARARGIVVCVENLFGGYRGAVYTASASRLAREIATVAHSNVAATLDFGHAYLREGFGGGDFLAEVQALAPFARHLHIHDNFGRQDDIWTYTPGERIAYGHGDLHLPVGWGSLPWTEVMQRCRFPAGAVFNIELQQRHWHAVKACIDATRRLTTHVIATA